MLYASSNPNFVGSPTLPPVIVFKKPPDTGLYPFINPEAIVPALVLSGYSSFNAVCLGSCGGTISFKASINKVTGPPTALLIAAFTAAS